jgi:hypothetical protein
MDKKVSRWKILIKRMKEEKRRKKELELRMSGQDTNSNHIKQDGTEDSDGEIKS